VPLTGDILLDIIRNEDNLCEIQDVIRWIGIRKRAWGDHINEIHDNRLAKIAKNGKLDIWAASKTLNIDRRTGTLDKIQNTVLETKKKKKRGKITSRMYALMFYTRDRLSVTRQSE
jgi:hypothetical protein